MTVLVTGGAGFIGGHTLLALRAAGYDVLALDNFSNGHEAQLMGAPFAKGDIRDAPFLARVFTDHRIEAVLHFAALIEAGRSVQEPDLFYDVNVNGTKNLLDTMQQYHVNTLVFSSTAAVYGNPLTTPITEDHPLAPINPYGATKTAVEAMLGNSSLRYAALRYFNAAGSDPQGRVGERHDPETHLIPLCIDAAFGRRAELQLFGTDYDTKDGTCIRDYVHVSDLADAHVLALQALQNGTSPFVCNLGTGAGFSVREVIDMVGKVTGKTVPYSVAPRRAGDPAVLVCSHEKAVSVLGWKPRWTHLEDMIEHAVMFRTAH